MISIIIPTYNEELNILHTLEQFVDVDSPQFEIIVSDGGSHDETLKQVDEFQKKYPQIAFQSFVSTIKGRAGQMNEGAKKAQGAILLFLHADTLLPKNGLNLIKKKLKNPDVIGGGFRLNFQPKHFLMLFLQAYSNFRASVFKTFLGDQCIFIRSDTFWSFGPYEDIPIFEDLNFCQKMKKAGKLVCIQPKAITSGRRIMANNFWKVCFWFLYTKHLYYRGIDPQVIAEKYKKALKRG